MSTKIVRSLLYGLTVMLVMQACSPGPMPAPLSTETLTLTYTPALAATPTQTDPPASTSTPTASPIPDSQTGRVVRSEHFDDLSALSFSMYGVGGIEIADGRLVLTEKMSPSDVATADGEAAGRSLFSPQPGHVSIFLFKVEQDSFFGYHFELYETTAKGDQYLGINLQQQGNGVALNFWRGPSNTPKLEHSFPVPGFNYNTWYYYSLQVLPDGKVTARIWERDQQDPVVFMESVQLDQEWAQSDFTFVVTCYRGRMEIDEYQEVELAIR